MPHSSVVASHVFRGQFGAPTPQTHLPSFTFVEDFAVASYYAANPNDRTRPVNAQTPLVLECRVSIHNPLTNSPNDAFIDYDDLKEKVGQEWSNKFLIRHSEHVTATCAWEEHFAPDYSSVEEVVRHRPDQLNLLCLQIWPLLDHPQTVADLKKLGIDGAVHRGSGVSLDCAEYRVFDVRQIETLAVHTPNQPRRPTVTSF